MTDVQSTYACMKCGVRWKAAPPSDCPNGCDKPAAASPPKYPEHEKMHVAKEKLGTEQIGQFLEWLQQDGIHLAKYHEHSDTCYTVEDRGVAGVRRHLSCYRVDDLFPTHESVQELLARYADIDLDRLEEEKRAMLDEIRRQQK